MGKIEQFSLTLNKSYPVYLAGENLIGNVFIKSKERLKINSVKLIIRGEAKVCWTEQHGETTVVHKASDKYLEHEITFLSKKTKDEELYLEQGNHTFQFEYILPKNLPTSFEFPEGKIRYTIEATIDIPWAFDKQSKKSFTVLSHLDLNTMPSLKKSYGVNDQKIICCGACKQEPIIADFNITKTGYVAGESVYFNVLINNKSNRSVKEMSVSLVQVIKAYATNALHESYRNMAIIKYNNLIKENSVENWNKSFLTIPSVCSSTNGTCKIIDVSYRLVLKFEPSGPSKSKKLIIPITIGTVPIKMDKMETNPSKISFEYEPCFFGQTADIPSDNESNDKIELIESDKKSFKPLYPFYKDFSIIYSKK